MKVYKDKFYSQEEGFALHRDEQEALLKDRGVKIWAKIKETELLGLILQSNPTSQVTKQYTLILDWQEIECFKRVLEIASAGFPDAEIQKLVAKLQQAIK